MAEKPSALVANSPRVRAFSQPAAGSRYPVRTLQRSFDKIELCTKRR